MYSGGFGPTALKSQQQQQQEKINKKNEIWTGSLIPIRLIEFRSSVARNTAVITKFTVHRHWV
jgi:hypothetical protein